MGSSNASSQPVNPRGSTSAAPAAVQLPGAGLQSFHPVNQQPTGMGSPYSYNPATGTAGFVNNGQNAVQGAINTGVGNSYSGLNTTTNELAGQYGGIANLYKSIFGGGAPTINGQPGATYQPTSSNQQPQMNGNLGGGWNTFAGQQGTPQNALMTGLNSGLSGQALVDQLNKNPATAGIAYYPDSNTYGLPNGYYAAPNAANGQMDLIQRSGGGGLGGSGSSNPITGYQQFAQTGGLSPQQIQAMQQQGEAPARAMAQNAQNDLQTQQALSGGYMPNFGAASLAAQRAGTQGATNADVATNAGIAQMIQSGQLQGLGGLLGMTGTLGNQMLGTSGQQLQGNSLANMIAQMLISGQLGQSQVPSNFNQGLGTASGLVNLGGAGLGAYSAGQNAGIW